MPSPRLKISAGLAKGMTLETHKSIRPTRERVRDAVWNSLFSRLGDFDGVRVLDIFAGSGGFGLEGMSRGCGRVDFVEGHPQVVRILRKNVENFLRYAPNLRKDIQIVQGSVGEQFDFRSKLGPEAAYDIVFCDPPYAEAETFFKLLLREALGLVKPGGWFVFEAPKAFKVPEETEETKLWTFDALKRYGESCFVFYEKKEEGEHLE